MIMIMIMNTFMDMDTVSDIDRESAGTGDRTSAGKET
jgi:hypothetical protein